ncbi:MAG: tetratricopeptide repeat protein [Bradymonadia bacterium]
MRTQYIYDLITTAETCVQDGMLFKATGYLRRVLELSRPGEFTAELALLRLSDVHQRQGRYTESIGLMQKAIESRPGESRYLLMLAELLKLNGELTEALAVAYDTISSPTTHQDGLRLIESINHQLGDYETVSCAVDPSRFSQIVPQ